MKLLLTILIIIPLLLLGGCAAYTAIDAPLMKKRFPPVGKFISVGDFRLHYIDAGPKDSAELPLIMIHGASGNVQDLSLNLLPALAENRRVLIFDRPGFGYSERPGGDWFNPAQQAAAIHQAATQLGVERAVVLGHSYGGTVALRFGLDFPAMTAKIISLAGPSHHWDGSTSLFYKIGKKPVIGPLFAWNVYYPAGRLLIEKVAPEVFKPNEMPENYIQNSAAPLALRPRTFLSNANDVGRLNNFLLEQETRYSELTMPVLLIWGTEDTVVGFHHHVPQLRKQLPDMHILTMEGVGHMPHHIAPEKVIEAVNQFSADAR